MSSMDLLDVGQANEFKLACRRNDFTPEDLKWLCEGGTLANVRRLRLGRVVITTVPEHLIDLNADPFVPDGWSIEEHRGGGQFKWDPDLVSLYLSEKQQDGKRIDGFKLREELENKPVYNANLLDYLLVHPHLIPEEWKGRLVFFWGTIYRSLGGGLRVRFLDWHSGWGAVVLDDGWYTYSPAAVPASVVQQR